MAYRKKKRLGNLLIEKGAISEEQLKIALAEQAKKPHRRLGHVLIQLGFADDKEVAKSLAAQLDIPYYNIEEEKIDENLIKLVPEFIVRKQLLLPVTREGNTLTIAMSDPFNVVAMDDLRLMTGLEIKCVASPEGQIKEAVDKFFGKIDVVDKILKDAEKESLEVIEEREDETDVGKLTEEGGETPVVNFVNHILIEAIHSGASDIHIEPYERIVRVRYRIDGKLYEVTSPPKRMHPAIVSRLKIMSNLDIAERRLPQDGRARVSLEGRDIDLRVSMMPTVYGEKVVMRILDPSSLCLDLTALGFEPDILPIYQDNLKAPYGIILVTGPTGSGKSTTLYSSLSTINSPDKNITTVEDPVEYNLAGINQVNVRPEIGFDFVAALRSFLRQDPDIIMVGEIRDRETAEIAVNAALTGHLVLSTLHTNDAPGAVTRLVNMGIEPFLISSTVVMTIAQRLLRKICPRCKEEYEVSPKILEDMGVKIGKGKEEKIKLYRGVGCDLCTNLGYKGRVAIYEVMTMSDEVRDAILNRESAHVLKAMAIKTGMISLRKAAERKVLAGVTTIEELLAATAEE
ncbi:type IV-A pilus assembly ATPase PilB [bacterium]|nr:type IV-A pilus assembly ATPase PilB [bacterium]